MNIVTCGFNNMFVYSKSLAMNVHMSFNNTAYSFITDILRLGGI